MGESIVVRVFFSTFLNKVAETIISALSKYGRIKTTHSRIVPGFYYVEITLNEVKDVNSIVEQIESEIKKLGSDYVYGVKIYYVRK